MLFLDIKMSKIDGFHLYQEMKKIDSKIKVCFLTASETCLIPSDVPFLILVMSPIHRELENVPTKKIRLSLLPTNSIEIG